MGTKAVVIGDIRSKHVPEMPLVEDDDLIERAGVATVPGTDFGAPDTLRLSLCSARFEEGIDRLARYFGASGVTRSRSRPATSVSQNLSEAVTGKGGA